MMRVGLVFFGIAVVFTIPFLLWGEAFEAAFSAQGSREWLERYGAWAWAAAIGLLMSDLVLPVPSTAVMSALGILYGPVLGGLIGAVGSFLAGTLAYVLCRLLGQRAARRLVGERDLERGRRFFARTGGWAVALSRWLPLLPEIIACLAGLTRMSAGRFFAALACGCLPMALVFAALGTAGVQGLVVSALVPLALWPLASRMLRGPRRRPGQ